MIGMETKGLPDYCSVHTTMSHGSDERAKADELGSTASARLIASWTCPTCSLKVPTTAATCPQDGTEICAQEQPDDWLATAYEFIGTIGAGGMSVIYKARQLSLNKLVAIKMLHSHLLNDQSILRFQQEARAASSLKHPNIIAVHDFGISQQGQPYMVMDFIAGETLADVIRSDGALPLPSAMDIFLAVCDALEHAHQHGVLHRDLKPSNIMLSKRVDGYDVHLVDFGIAKIIDSEAGGVVQQLTQTGEVMGSPLYMSPEQCMGKKLDQRSDIYSFGCILYEAVVGTPPHIGDTMIETIFKHLNETPLSLRQARPDISFPQAFEDLSMKLLSNKPEDRFQTFSEVKRKLLDIQAGALHGVGKPKTIAPRLNFKVSRATAVCIVGVFFALVGVVSLVICNNTLYRSQELERESAQQMRLAKQLKEASSLAHSNFSQVAVDKDSVAPGDVTCESLCQLNPRLEALNLSDKNVSNGSLVALSRLSRLQSLDLSNTAITDEAIEPLLRLKTLTKINLTNTRLSPDALSQLSSLPNLRELYLDNTATNDADLLSFGKLPNLSTLELRDTPITDSGLEHLTRARNLTQLSISGTDISDRGVAAIGQMKLARLNMWDTNVSAGGLVNLKSCKSLTQLTLSRLKVKPEDVIALSELPALNYLQLYHIANLKDEDIRSLVKLRSLAELYIEDCPLTDRCATYLDQMPQLTGLALNRTKITDQALMRIGHLQKLKSLWLEEARIADVGLESLSKLRSLKNLYISGSLVSDVGLKQLAASPNLSFIEAYYCPNISRRGIAAFKKVKPNCSVHLHYID